ncbi:MAG TPA: hypothetical protein DCQ31_16605 [Bacteroidales bacterium]|nr:hypothetical protein [Bacteroidales bacterium]
MYRIVLYNSANQKQESATNLLPVLWFDGVFEKNEIPYPILYNKKNMKTSSGELILAADSYFLKFNTGDFLRIESNLNGSSVFLLGNILITTDKPIDEFENVLKNSLFFRVHANHLINMRYTERIVKCDSFIILSNSDAIPMDTQNNEPIFKFLEGKELI